MIEMECSRNGGFYIVLFILVNIFVFMMAYSSSELLVHMETEEFIGIRGLSVSFNPILTLITSLLVSFTVCMTMFRCRSFVSIPFFFISSLLLFHTIATLVLSTNDYYLPWIHSTIAIIAFLLATITSKSITRYHEIEVYSLSTAKYRVIVFVVLLLYLLLCAFYYIYPTPVIVALMKGDFSTLSVSIIENRKSLYDALSYHGSGYIELVRTGLLPTGTAVLFLNYLIIKKSPAKTITVYAFVAVCLLFSILSGQRWPMGFFIMFIALCYYSISKINLIITSLMVLLFISLFVFLSIMNHRMVMEGGMITQALSVVSGLIYRISIASNAPSFHAYDVFPNIIPFGFGITWIQDILAYLPGPDELLGTKYAKVIGMKWGSAPLTFFGETYANGGFISVFLCFFLFSKILWQFESYFQRQNPKSVLLLVAHTSLCLGMVRMFYGSGIGIVSYHVLPILFYSVLLIDYRK